MSSFSTIKTPKGSFQFKTGHDDHMGVYEVGDAFPWQPDNRSPGSHPDGVHDAEAYWVVIKNCVVVAIEPRLNGDPGYDDDNPCQRLIEKYGITDPPRDLWPEEAWRKRAEAEAKALAKMEAWKAAHGGSLDGYYIRMRMEESSILNQLLPPIKVEGNYHKQTLSSGRAKRRAEKLARYRAEKKSRKRGS